MGNKIYKENADPDQLESETTRRLLSANITNFINEGETWWKNVLPVHEMSHNMVRELQEDLCVTCPECCDTTATDTLIQGTDTFTDSLYHSGETTGYDYGNS